MVAILSSSVVGFLAVIVAAVSPDTVFSFLLNSSGAVILFVYLLIAVSQIILRRPTSRQLKVKMWWFPALSVLTVARHRRRAGPDGAQRGRADPAGAEPASLAVVLVIFFVNKRMRRTPAADRPTAGEPARPGRARVLVLANQTLDADELIDELQRSTDGQAEYFVCVPANAVETGLATHEGAVSVRDATTEAAQARLDRTLSPARRLDATGDSVTSGRCGRCGCGGGVQSGPVVICTHPEDRSAWLRYDVVERAREAYDIPITHVIVESIPAGV